ncbi:MAG: aminotransferase class V-fold PLP-dependent enzyme [bacterium]|nr:aminotransferase class V-fold PLP-dependent enzyme [candidate division KSB1 bacterium]MDH7561616.1 aminotransferase class V-fold PLP-dependent enzyme [bacterium]
MSEYLYLDNAATTWPKPPAVRQAMVQFMDKVGANPGRSGHRMSLAAARLLYRGREEIAALVGCDDPLRVVFCANATAALNLALHGLLNPGDHVVCTSMEHNSVMRPLRVLEQGGVLLTVVQCSVTGELTCAAVEQAITPRTRLIVATHASNAVGTLLPVDELAQLATKRNVLLLVDAAQTLGAIPLDLRQTPIDLLAFTGHKALFGPMGTGGLVIGPRVPLSALKPLLQGGTGSRSEEEEQPDFLPDKYESGTPNVVGVAGLAAGVRWLRRQGVETIRAREEKLTAHLLSGLKNVAGVTIYGPDSAARRAPVVLFNVEGKDPAVVAQRLDRQYGIMCRPGLHCAPRAHRTIGTFPQGAVRFSLSAFTTRRQIERAVQAVARIAGGKR